MTEENKAENPVLWHVDIPEDVRSEFANVGGRKLSIVAFGIKRASQFKPHDDNWRLHPKAQQRAVDGSLESLGWIDAPIENRITGSLVDGHERIWNALKNGDGYVPYKQVELTEAEEAQALLTLDPIAEMAKADTDKMKSLMLHVKENSAGSLDNENVKEFLSGLADENRIENPFEEPKPEDPGADLNLADELQKKWKVQSGQLWKCGEHRLICGDCTDEAVVERLMGGEKAGAVVTDPPFWNNSEIMHDQISCVSDSFSISRLYCDGVMFWFWDNLTEPPFEEKPNARHVWHKTNGWQAGHWEAINEYRNNTDERGESMVYSFPNVGVVVRSDVGNHPTPKPPELIKEFINCENILDPFLGSGTTLIACERLNRKCFGIEIDPSYCSVVLERWSQMTGNQPELIED